MKVYIKRVQLKSHREGCEDVGPGAHPNANDVRQTACISRLEQRGRDWQETHLSSVQTNSRCSIKSSMSILGLGLRSLYTTPLFEIGGKNATEPTLH